MVHNSVGAAPGARLESAERHFLFVGACLGCLFLFHDPLRKLIQLGVQDDRYTADLLIPFLSVILLWLRRKFLFRDLRYSPIAGSAFLLSSLLLAVAAAGGAPLPGNYLFSAQILAFIMALVGLFVLCYGWHVAKTAAFPLALLLLTVPVPVSLLDHLVVALQTGSAAVSYRLFQLAGVPVERETAVRFGLPGVSIEVGQECSGIRSSLSLFITSLVVGYVLLRSAWSRVAFSLLTLPVVIVKNALRIVTISCLGVYVDSGFFYGRLHRNSGLPFSVVAIIMLVPLLLLLIRAERVHEIGRSSHVLPIRTRARDSYPKENCTEIGASRRV